MKPSFDPLIYGVLEFQYSKWLKTYNKSGVPVWTPHSSKAAQMTKKDAMKHEKAHPFTIRAVGWLLGAVAISLGLVLLLFSWAIYCHM